MPIKEVYFCKDGHQVRKPPVTCNDCLSVAYCCDCCRRKNRPQHEKECHNMTIPRAISIGVNEMMHCSVISQYNDCVPLWKQICHITEYPDWMFPEIIMINPEVSLKVTYCIASCKYQLTIHINNNRLCALPPTFSQIPLTGDIQPLDLSLRCIYANLESLLAEADMQSNHTLLLQ